MTRVSVIILARSRAAGEGLATRIHALPGFQVHAAPAAAADALREVGERKPDLVLLDLGSGEHSLMLAEALRGKAPESRVIVIGADALRMDVASWVRAGVWAFIMAAAPVDQVRRTLHSVSRGIPVLPAELTHRLFDQLRGGRSGLRKARRALVNSAV